MSSLFGKEESIAAVWKNFQVDFASYTTVNSISPMRCAAVLLVLGGGLAYAQSSGLPPTPPTADLLPRAVPASSLTKAERASHRAEVTYSGNALEVTADNSSLNQILREIARATGMKITGGVTDERVYGKYGPAPAQQVLASLLDGTGSNMFLRETSQGTPGELVLTQKSGGPTPPNPNAPGFDDESQAEERVVAPQPPAPASSPGPVPLPFSRPVPTPPLTDTQMTPVTPPPSGIVDAPTVAPATEPGTTPGPTTQSTGTSDTTSGTADPNSPNGVKTPQQIYQELQQLQQQQKQPANPQ